MGSRQDRGRHTELLAARYYQSRLWPECVAQAASIPGRDLLRTPGAAVEVKARSRFNPAGWMRQAVRNSGDDTPLVLMRPVGMGPESIDQWLVFMRNRDFVTLWRDAYGDRSGGVRPPAGEDSGSDLARYRVGVGPESGDDGGAFLQAVLSPVLRALGFEPGDYEVAVRRRTGGAGPPGVRGETAA